MLVILSGISIDVSVSHEANAHSPILVTFIPSIVLGIIIFVRVLP